MPGLQQKTTGTGTRASTKKRAPAKNTLVAQPEQPVLTPAILASQRSAMALAEQLFEASTVCRCVSCKSMLLREKAEALAALVAKVMEMTMQKSSGEYMSTLRLLAKCRASTPSCSGGGGSGWAMPAMDVVYDRCVRTEPVLSTQYTGAAALSRMTGRL